MINFLFMESHLFQGIVISILSYGAIYVLRKGETILSQPEYRYLDSFKWLTTFIKLYLLYLTSSTLTTLEISYTSFPLYLFDKYVLVCTISFMMSLITTIIGYPVLFGLYYYAEVLLHRLSRSSSTLEITFNNDRYRIRELFQHLQSFMDALIHNRNWSLTIGDTEIKTYQSPIKLTEEEINAICPLRYLGLNNHIKAKKTCSICIDELNPKQLHRELPCGHGYHASCIDEWLLIHRNCPLCRKFIN